MSHAAASRAAAFPASGHGLSSPVLARGLLAATIVVAAVAGLLATDADTTARALAEAGADWGNLLRAMAGLKLSFAAAAAAAVFWRLAAPVSPARLGAYAVSAAAVWAGPGLIWGLDHIALGAVLLHAGLLATAVLLWRDPQVGVLVSEAVARRRARL